MAAKKYTRDDCVMLLCSKRESLAASGVERLPQRSDFAEDEVVAIKAFLGPWPRALEAAGLKAASGVDRIEKNREKRRRAERRRREAKRAERLTEKKITDESTAPDESQSADANTTDRNDGEDIYNA